VIVVGIAMLVLCRVVVRRAHGLVQRLMGRRHPVVLQMQFHLTARLRNFTKHRRRNNTPNGKQYGEQQQQPGATGSHGK